MQRRQCGGFLQTAGRDGFSAIENRAGAANRAAGAIHPRRFGCAVYAGTGDQQDLS